MSKRLTICTSLNSWVAMNVLGGEVEIPMEVVNGLTGNIMRL
jgi:hypothetical protein